MSKCLKAQHNFKPRFLKYLFLPQDTHSWVFINNMLKQTLLFYRRFPYTEDSDFPNIELYFLTRKLQCTCQ